MFDSLGNPHVMSSYYVKTSAGHWDVYAASDGVEITNLKVAVRDNQDNLLVDERGGPVVQVRYRDLATGSPVDLAFDAR